MTAEQARTIFRQGEEAVVFALLTLAKKAAPTGAPSPTTPSGMTPVYQKPAVKRRRKKAGRKAGHPGRRRPPPAQIDRHEAHTLDACPQCHGPVSPCRSSRTRLIEDIPADITPVVTAHTIHRYWCSQCQQTVEPTVPDALPGSTLGLRVLVLSAWLHYALGNTLAQIVAVFNFHLRLKLSPGGLVHMWYRLQEILFAWYEQIQAEALAAAVLHADETGWRVGGKTYWLWCFTTNEVTYYLIDRCRGSPVLKRFFQKHFAGTLVSDFWGAYNAVACARRQKCIPHLLRELKKVDHYHRPDGDWKAFAKKLRRLVRDGLRLRQRQRPAAECAAGRQRLEARLQALIAHPWENAHARRLVKRLRRHAQELFTFLDHPEVPFDNNHAERMIRPAVIIRKNSYANGSDAGADLQAVLMSIYRTLQQRGHNPLQTIVAALRSYLNTGVLTPLPKKITEDS
ncbi:MAG: IS66 family transposase [Acidobacteria bacterium]|nr:IS66 family transposase [Acidobacteriota bacterium]